MTAQTEHRLKIALWCVPIIFSLGSLYSVVTVGSADVSDRMGVVEDGLKVHAALKAHPVTESRLDVLVTEQRALRADVAEANETLAGICAAIDGARCK